MTSTKEDRAYQLLDVIVEKGKCKNSRPRPSIYMAPDILRDLNPRSFEPRVVSIGPLHRGDKKLQAFEGHKPCYMFNLMQRTRECSQENMLKLCVQKMYESKEKIKDFYALEFYNEAKLVNMMIVDACFILEFLFVFKKNDKSQNKEGILLYKNLLFDLVLLENQIPFFVLEEIFQCTLLKYHPSHSLLELIHPLLDVVNIFKIEGTINYIPINEPRHILSLLHQFYKPPVDITKGGVLRTIFPSVTDLDRAGVSFEPNKNAKWLMGMEVKLNRLQCVFQFWSKPILKMPVLKVDDNTDLVLRNLIAYEQSGSNHDAYVTSYAFALDSLVDTQPDVAKLVDSKVLLNFLGSDEEVANFINSMCKDAVLENFFYKNQWEALNNHYEGYWTKNIAMLKRNYFGSPWSMIALVAGIILFVLTVVQTIFTVIPP
ncbi:UPF0481 protein At3g47200-like [Bidens hawaiensis]|uniref:UPF0481 protein At3g47200-like n=1 Tax=Bidens hawaiensis TaxID=980011 RepID=UPI00404B77E8